MAVRGYLRLFDPLKTTTAEIYEGWRRNGRFFYVAMAAGERVTVSWTRAFPRSRLLAEIADEEMLRG